MGVQIEGFQVKNEVFVLHGFLSFNCDDDDDDDDDNHDHDNHDDSDSDDVDVDVDHRFLTHQNPTNGTCCVCCMLPRGIRTPTFLVFGADDILVVSQPLSQTQHWSL